MAFDYEFRLRVRAARPIVFERLLRIEHLARWFCGWARIEPKLGGSFQFGGETCIFLPEGRGWDTKIDEGDPLRTFAFTWPIRGAATRVSYALQDEGEGACLLVARHRGVPVRETTCGMVQDAWRTCLGNLKSVAEGRGDSVRPDHSPPGDDLRVTALVSATPARVFRALTDPAEVDRWATGGVPSGEASVEPRVGGTYAIGTPDGPARIVEIEADRRLVLRWPPAAGHPDIALALEEKASGTAVYLAGTGYPAGDGARIVRDRGRWSDRLVSLGNLVEGSDAGFANPYEDQVREG